MQRKSLLVCLTVISQFIFAQRYQPVEQYTIDHGLPHSSVSCLYFDSRDLLWVGTADGLSRFNGISFHNYQSSIYDTISLPNDHILGILEDDSGTIWCLTSVSLSKYISQLDGFVSYYFYPEGSAQVDPVKLKDFVLDSIRQKIYILGDKYLGEFDLEFESVRPLTDLFHSSSIPVGILHSIDILTEAQTLLFQSSNKILEYNILTQTITEIDIPGLKFGERFQIEPGCHESYWVYTVDQIWKRRGESKLETFGYRSEIPGIRTPIIDIVCHQEDRLDLITSNQIFDYDYSEQLILDVVEYEAGDLDPLDFRSFIKMKCGVFWLATDQGLFKFNKHNHVFKQRRIDDYLGAGTEITSIVFDTNSYLYLAAATGDILVLDTRTMEQIPEKAVKRISLNSRINTLIRGLDGKLWAGTGSGIYEVSSAQPMPLQGSTPYDIKTIYALSADTLVCAARSKVFGMLIQERRTLNFNAFDSYLDQEILGIFEKNDLIYCMQSSRILEYNPETNVIEVIPTIHPAFNIVPENNTLIETGKGKIIIGTSDGIFESTSKRINLRPLSLHHALNNQHIYAIARDKNNRMWLSTNNGLFSTDSTRATIRRYTYADGLEDMNYSNRLAATAPNGKLCFAGKTGFVLFQPARLPKYVCDHSIEIMDVKLMGRDSTYLKSLTGIDSITVDPIYRHMQFTFASLDYWNPPENRLAYSLVKIGKPENWVSLENENSILISGLRAGLYSLKVDGTNHSGHWNNRTRELIIRVNAPIWQSRIAIILYGVFLVLFIYILIYFRTKHLWKLNREYKEREIIAKQIELQKEELSLKNKNITDSINYAKRIQMALMPSRKLFAKIFPDSFILHMPKDIVSGDFYWINEVAGRIYFAAVDCTGHGVPGAFMSIIGFELFRRITEIEKKKQPAEILNSLSKGFETIFQDVENITLRDGMDVAFCAVDKEMNVLEFAGAFNPLYLVRDNTITEIKGDRCSVGLDHEWIDMEGVTFSDHVIQLREGDIIYIFTDGFADQFGGPEGKKYKYRRFRHLLLALHQLPMERQVEFLQRSILDWKGNLDQVDDILVMGLRITKK